MKAFLQHCAINVVVYATGALVYFILHHFGFQSAFIIGAIFVRSLGREADSLMNAMDNGVTFWDWLHS